MLPILLKHGGPMMFLLLVASAVAIYVFIERFLHYHTAQINAVEFLTGVRNVIRRENIVEALSICDATPGPVPRLEEKLNVLATIAQIAPLMGLLGTVLGFIKIFSLMQSKGPYANALLLSGGVWEALICTAMGLVLAIPCYAGYNFLVSRVNQIVLEMEKAATEILNIMTETPAAKSS